MKQIDAFPTNVSMFCTKAMRDSINGQISKGTLKTPPETGPALFRALLPAYICDWGVFNRCKTCIPVCCIHSSPYTKVAVHFHCWCKAHMQGVVSRKPLPLRSRDPALVPTCGSILVPFVHNGQQRLSMEYKVIRPCVKLIDCTV